MEGRQQLDDSIAISWQGKQLSAEAWNGTLRRRRWAGRLDLRWCHEGDEGEGSARALVAIESDRSLKLNGEEDVGTLDDMSKLTHRLVAVFDQRTRNRAYRPDMINRFDLPDAMRVEKTVFIKAPRTFPYGEVTRVIDGLKATGADPIGLQLDNLK